MLGALLIGALAAAGCGEDDAERAASVCDSVTFSGQAVTKAEPTTAGAVVELLRSAGEPTAWWDQQDSDDFVAVCTLAAVDEGVLRAAVHQDSASSVLLPGPLVLE
jgi:threonine aldolase